MLNKRLHDYIDENFVRSTMLQNIVIAQINLQSWEFELFFCILKHK